jgi:high-affinity iron transporter
MLGALIIVFREVIEAGIIVGVVLAVTRGIALSRVWISIGVAGGIIGAALVAAFAGAIADALQGMGQELFNGSILAVAVIMLTWHNVWMASHGREMARELKAAGHKVKTGERTLLALSVVVGVAVLREGSEVVLFLYGIAAQGGTSASGMVVGGGLGLLAGAAVSALMYFGLLTIPAGKLFQVTSGLITLLAAGMAAQAVIFLQNGGWLEYFTATVWDTSWLITEDSITGRLLHTLIGYSQAPNGAQLIAYAATVLLIVILMRTVPQGGPARTQTAPKTHNA